MELLIGHEVYPIKNGWAARSPQLKLTAHGFSKETARLNLERGVKLFLRPFQREGTLEAEIASMGLTVNRDGVEQEIIVTLT